MSALKYITEDAFNEINTLSQERAKLKGRNIDRAHIIGISFADRVEWNRAYHKRLKEIDAQIAFLTSV